jgi:hypothetical protein
MEEGITISACSMGELYDMVKLCLAAYVFQECERIFKKDYKSGLFKWRGSDNKLYGVLFDFSGSSKHMVRFFEYGSDLDGESDVEYVLFTIIDGVFVDVGFNNSPDVSVGRKREGLISGGSVINFWFLRYSLVQVIELVENVIAGLLYAYRNGRLIRLWVSN